MVDTDTGIVGIVDAMTLELVSQASMATMTGGRTTMTATADGKLVVARDAEVRVIDSAGRPQAGWTAPGPVDGLTAASATPLIYASVGGKILTFDTTGAPRGEVGVLS